MAMWDKEKNRQYMRELIAQRRSEGLCLNCGKPAREGKVQCQECADKQTQWRRKNRKHEKEQEQPHTDAVRLKARRQRMREFIQQQKGGLHCERCGSSDFRVLDFHHIDKEVKEIGVAQAVARGWSEKHILAEIEKCRVLCSNCHRILHWEESYGTTSSRAQADEGLTL
jgi:hypothetical protein